MGWPCAATEPGGYHSETADLIEVTPHQADREAALFEKSPALGHFTSIFNP